MATLQQQYDSKQKTIRKEIEILIEKLDKHQKKQNQNSTNWSYPGDLSNIEEKIKEINRFLR